MDSSSSTANRRFGMVMFIFVAAMVAGLVYMNGSSSQQQALLPFLSTKSQTLLIPSMSLAEEETKVKKPNIVFLLVDDQGYNDVGYNSNDLHITPTIDALASDGIKLDRYYTMYVCTPARASLLTGKNAIKTGTHYQVLHDSAPWGLPLEHVLLPQYLKVEADYSTHMVGKWHLGFFHPAYIPTSRGFDSSFGFYAGQETYYSHNIIGTSEQFLDWFDNGRPYPEALGRFSLELMEERVDEIIRKEAAAGDPFFLLYSQQAIHYPLEDVPESYLSDDAAELIERFEVPNRRGVGQLAAALDLSVGRLVATLQAEGVWDNTVLIVASDNGGCTHYGGNNWPLRGGKNSLWEGGLRVPAFIHSPLLPEAARGTTYEELVHVSDWLPTIMGMLGVDGPFLKTLDGVDQWAALTGQAAAGAAPPRTSVLHNIEYAYDYHPTQYRAALTVRAGDRDLKLVTGETWDASYAPEVEDTNMQTCSQYFYSSSGETYVFDTRADPGEEEDLLAAGALDDATLAMLWKALDGHAAEVGDPAFQVDKWDLGCYRTWTEHGHFLVPWHAGLDLPEVTAQEIKAAMGAPPDLDRDEGPRDRSHEMP
uniref:Sulfatase N-terminal domain-containing protein n=1 Tax=Heterosigma akashiwo TaxID=2829 RepID=A0A7S3XL37_HETAK